MGSKSASAATPLRAWRGRASGLRGPGLRTGHDNRDFRSIGQPRRAVHDDPVTHRRRPLVTTRADIVLIADADDLAVDSVVPSSMTYTETLFADRAARRIAE